MGCYRLALAYLVLCSHVPLTLAGQGLGQVAVISFLLLSGYVMTALVDRHYPARADIGWFYLDRLARLYPQYLLYLLATLAAVHGCGLYSGFITLPPSLGLVAAQFLVIPLDFSMYLPADYIALPQAWSLGLEACFYLAFPWVLLHRLRLPLAIASAGVFLLAHAGVINADTFGYRLLPGTLFIFILGSWLRRCETPGERLGFRVLAGGGFVGFLLATGWPGLGLVHGNDTLLGLILGLPMVAWLARLRPAAWDNVAGNLSYGVFLNHYLLILLLNAWVQRPLGWADAALVGLVSTGLSALSFRLVEQPVLRLRQRLRNHKGRPAWEQQAA